MVDDFVEHILNLIVWWRGSVSAYIWRSTIYILICVSWVHWSTRHHVIEIRYRSLYLETELLDAGSGQLVQQVSWLEISLLFKQFTKQLTDFSLASSSIVLPKSVARSVEFAVPAPQPSADSLYAPCHAWDRESSAEFSRDAPVLR